MDKILHSPMDKLLEFAGSQKNIDLVAKWFCGGVALAAFIMAAAVGGHLIIR